MKDRIGALTSFLAKGIKSAPSPFSILRSIALVLVLVGCRATSPPATISSPPATVAVPPAITPLLPITPTPSPVPAVTPVPSPALSKVEKKVEGPVPTGEIMEPKNERSLLTITIVYDNNAYDPRLKTAWGFSCLIEYRGQVILFDTGGDSPTLLTNMATLGIDPGEIEAVVLSHIHSDHTDGLSGLLHRAGDGLTVFVPQSFPARFKDAVKTRDPTTTVAVQVVEIHEPREIGEKVYTTGELGTGIIEQSLVVRTDEGLVVVTGCAHPGIVEIVRKAKALSGDEVYLVLGGFHLGGKSQREIERIISEFCRLGVRKVAPCHCTGEQAIKMFRQEYGENFIQAGAGKVIHVPPSE